MSKRFPSLPSGYQIERALHPELPVYAALDRTATPVVIKFGSTKNVWTTERASEALVRLEREADLLERWRDCPNVVRLVERKLDHPKGPFLVLERLGPSVEQGIPEYGLEVDQSIKVVRDIGVALAAIHELGDVHYDVKPDNILLHPDTGQWALIDPGDEQLRTNDYTCDRLRGWEADVLSLGRTFITLLTGTIDTDLDDETRHGMSTEAGGAALVRLLDRMLQHPGQRRVRTRHSRPSAIQLVRILKRISDERRELA